MKKSQQKALVAFATAALYLGLPGCSAMSPEDASTEDDGTQASSRMFPVGTAATTLSVVGQRPTALALVGADIPLVDVDGSVVGSLNMSQALLALDKIKLLQAESAGLSLQSDDTQETEDESENESESDDSAEQEDEQDQFEFKGPFICNLIDNTMSPSPESLLIPDGAYSGIKMEMKRLEEEDVTTAGFAANHPMANRSLYVEGQITWAADSSVTPFTMEYKIDEEFIVAGTGAVGMAKDVANSVVIAFKLANWLNLSNAAVNEEGASFVPFVGATALALSEDSTIEAEKALWKAIKEGIKSSTKFGKDEDGSGDLEEDEDNDAENDSEEDETEEEVQE